MTQIKVNSRTISCNNNHDIDCYIKQNFKDIDVTYCKSNNRTYYAAMYLHDAQDIFDYLRNINIQLEPKIEQYSLFFKYTGDNKNLNYQNTEDELRELCNNNKVLSIFIKIYKNSYTGKITIDNFKDLQFLKKTNFDNFSFYTFNRNKNRSEKLATV